MTVGIHQPNFAPWLGYFNKIYRSDVFVIIDEVQFAKGSVCNRCKIKNDVGEEIWFTVPVKPENGSASDFRQVKIADPLWYKKGINLLKPYYLHAPYFNAYFPSIEELLKQEYSSLAEMNISLIRYICKVFEINTPIYIQSEIETKFGKKNDLNLGITKYFKGNIYLSGNGAKKYNDHELFREQGVEIEYLNYQSPVYSQINGPFVPNLSVLDVLFNEGENGAKYVKMMTPQISS